MKILAVLSFAVLISCSKDDSAPLVPAGKSGCLLCAIDTDLVSTQPSKGAKQATSVVVVGNETSSIGSPRTIRIVYFRPSDRPFRQTLADSIGRVMKQSQSFFAEQMEAHGYGNQSFRLETDGQGEPLVYLFNAEHPEEYYADSRSDEYRVESERYGRIASYLFEISSVFDLDENIYVVVRDFTKRPRNNATGSRISKKSGTARTPPWGLRLKTMAHELGHAFGLPHDYRDSSYMLSYGSTRDRLSSCSARFLSVHPYFNDATSWSDPSPPTVDLIYPVPLGSGDIRFEGDGAFSIHYPVGLKSIPIRIRVQDADGIDQILFEASPGWGYGGTRECRSYDGEESIVAEFEYDGSSMAAVPDGDITDLSDSPHAISFHVVDKDGNIKEARFNLRLDGT